EASGAGRSEIFKHSFADLRNIARDFLGDELRVTRPNLEFVDVNGSVNILLHDLLRDHDGVLKVVTVPRHERDEHVATERELAVLRVRAVSDDLAAFHVLALLHHWLLIYACARV